MGVVSMETKTTMVDTQNVSFTPPELQTRNELYNMTLVVWHQSAQLSLSGQGRLKDHGNKQDATWMGNTMARPLPWTTSSQHGFVQAMAHKESHIYRIQPLLCLLDNTNIKSL